MSGTWRGLIRFWIPVVVWLGWMFFASTDVMSSEHTSRFIGPFLRWWNPDISQWAIESIQLVVRKFAHVVEYAILAILLGRAIQYQIGRVGSRFCLVVAVTLSLTAVLAVVDEFHQSFVPSRTSSGWDILLDLGGASLGLVLWWGIQRRQLKQGRVKMS